MLSHRPAAIVSGSLSQAIPLQNNCALRPFPPGMPHEQIEPVKNDRPSVPLPFFLKPRRTLEKEESGEC